MLAPTQGVNDLWARKRINEAWVSVKDYGAVGDGTTDDTSTIQQCFDHVSSIGGGTVFFPSGTYMVNAETSIFPKSNTHIILDENAIIKALPTSNETYRVIWFNSVSDISIAGGTVSGDRSEHTGTGGEHGHCVQFSGCTNYRMEKIKVINAWGDGIYIGSKSDGKLYCENGKLIDVTADNNRRQGISVISAKTLEIVRPRLINTNGTAPECGLDFEPNYSYHVLSEIHVIDPYTENNNSSGINVNPSKLVDGNNKVDILISHHCDVGSTNGFSLYGGDGTVDGKIIIDKPIYKNNEGAGISIRKYTATLPRIEIVEPFIFESNQSEDTAGRYGSGITVFAESTDSGTEPLGNVHIYRPIIKSTGDIKPVYAIFFRDYRTERTGEITDISVIDPIELDASYGCGLPIYAANNIFISDKFKVMEKSLTESTTILLAGEYYKTYHNAGSTANVIINLSNNLPVGIEITAENRVGTYYIDFNPDDTSAIYPNSGVAGVDLRSVQKGAKMTLRKASSTEWYVIEQIGTWT